MPRSKIKAKTLKRIDRSFDRFCEAHFWLHTMEDNYHQSDAFRWSLNAFITTIIAIPELVHKAANEAGANTPEINSIKAIIINNNIFTKLQKYRNDIVHNQGLIIDSSGTIGLYDGRKMRLGISFPIDPSHDSYIAIINYLRSGDILNLMMPDEDNYPVVYREWKSSEFEEDILTTCRKTLLILSEYIHKISQILLEDYKKIENQFSLECCKPIEKIQIKHFNRNDLMRDLCPHFDPK